MTQPSLHGLNWTNKAAEIVLATALLAWPVAAISATDDFGTEVVEKHLRNLSMHWFGIQEPLEVSAPPTSGPYRTPTQAASTQVLLADELRAEYVTRSVGDSADTLAFWPADDSPMHLMFCIEGSRHNLRALLPEGLVQKFNPGVQRVRLRDGAVETLVRGTDGCDGIRRTPWGTILFTDERTDGVYEIINPLQLSSHTITDRTLGASVDQNGLPYSTVLASPECINGLA